jgi:predicted RNA-binding Zn-ribbon protein involved in translation (DUF1610 family)
MPLYEAFVRQAIEARDQALVAVRDSRRIVALSQVVRDAHAGRTMIVRCASCDSLQIGDEWLNLQAIGTGQQRIAAEIRANASHGICPTCFDVQMRTADDRRAASRA